MKHCIQCGQGKPLADFYAHPNTADGKLPRCKVCHRANVTANRNSKLDYYRGYDRRRASEDARACNVARVVAGYRARNPDRVAANNALARAVRSGVVAKPAGCWHCGSTRGVGGHHASYSRDMRLAVSWLCQACHKAVHQDTERLQVTAQVTDNSPADYPAHEVITPACRT